MSIFDQFRLDGRVALVTGASRGIGRAIAVALAEAGADVIVHYAGNCEAAVETADAIRKLGRRSEVVGVDLSDSDAAPRLYRDSIASLGRVDLLILNASVQFRNTWENVPRAELEQTFNVNFRASFELIQHFLPPMVQRKSGRILTVGSVQQYVPSPAMPIYAASKAAQMSLVTNLAKQVAGSGVTINNLAPGVIGTDRNAMVMDTAEKREKLLQRIPVGFVGEPRDCAGATLLLCSDAGRYITGTEILVDGGWALP